MIRNWTMLGSRLTPVCPRKADRAVCSTAGPKLARHRRGFYLTLMLAVSAPAFAEEPSAARGTDFDGFRRIAERNIFNPNRSTTRPAPAPTRPAARPPKVESFTLVGTFGDGQRWIAFFDGSNSRLRGRLLLNDTIGDHLLTAITKTGVVLQNGTNSILLRVGMQLRREEDGPWFLAERVEYTSGESAASRSRRSNSTSTSTSIARPATRDDQPENDVVQRLRQQRERELE